MDLHPRAGIFIIAIEIGMVDRLRREIPGKTLIAADPNAEYPSTKRVMLENIYDALRDEILVVKVEEEIGLRAV